MRGILIAFAMLISLGAQAASLRTMTTLHGPNVYLRDLFEDAGSNADRTLGPGPEPGGRIIVEAAQLNAIARQYNVAWRSVSRADRAVLEWPGRRMRKEDAVEAVRLAVTATGASDDIDIELTGFTAPLIPMEASTTATVSQLEYDSNTGRFNAALSVTGEGMNPIDTRISGRVDMMEEVPVAVARLLPETILRPEDVRISRVRTSQIRTEIAHSLDQVAGMALRRPVPAGQPLQLADLIRPPLVQRGATVRVELAVASLSITGQATALDSGADGDTIRVQNTTSRALLSARVIGPNQVRVTPETPVVSSVRADRRVNRP